MPSWMWKNTLSRGSKLSKRSSVMLRKSSVTPTSRYSWSNCNPRWSRGQRYNSNKRYSTSLRGPRTTWTSRRWMRKERAPTSLGRHRCTLRLLRWWTSITRYSILELTTNRSRNSGVLEDRRAKCSFKSRRNQEMAWTPIIQNRGTLSL